MIQSLVLAELAHDTHHIIFVVDKTKVLEDRQYSIATVVLNANKYFPFDISMFSVMVLSTGIDEHDL